MTIERFTDNDYWNGFVHKSNNTVQEILFSDIFNRFLEKDPNKKILEIGCGGGQFLFYLNKYFHIQTLNRFLPGTLLKR
jgi:2-polyprenyl-3-methyl-5-hydroxy-6-metoxy-1,4-benzoquinol methylase